VRKKVLFEDILNYNKWVSGIASRELASQRVTLRDLFNKNYVDQHPNDTQADPVLPFPLQSVIEQIGDLYINACNSRKLFKDSLNNPVISKNQSARDTVKDVISKLDTITDIIQNIIKQTNKPVAKKEE